MKLKKLILIIGLSLIGIGILVGVIIYIRTNADTREQITFEAEIEAEMEAYAEEYPIILNLPIVRKNYRIDYGLCQQSNGEFCLMISARPGYAEDAEKVLYGLDGFSEDYEIEYYNCDGYCNE